MVELPLREPLIIDFGKPGRHAASQFPPPSTACDIPAELRRADVPRLPAVSEMQVVRHFTRFSQMNFSIDTHFYPLGSCTMKYNPKACNAYAMLPEFLAQHPLGPEPQGFLACMFELQEMPGNAARLGEIEVGAAFDAGQAAG
jgi:glycine dehydrogenase subunit 2